MIVPAKADRGTVVFWVLPSLTYNVRMAVGFAFITAVSAGAAASFFSQPTSKIPVSSTDRPNIITFFMA